MPNYKKVTHLMPYIPESINLRGYILDFTVESVGPQRIKDMPFAQMQVLLGMAERGGLMFDVNSKHFSLDGNGEISIWKQH